jgi:hypothetical protein
LLVAPVGPPATAGGEDSNLTNQFAGNRRLASLRFAELTRLAPNLEHVVRRVGRTLINRAVASVAPAFRRRP